MIWLSIAVGGAIGSVLRHLVAVATLRWYGEVVPAAVAMINVTGCFLIGLAAGMIAAGQWIPHETVRAFVFVGILGGFTTFSSFGLDTLILVREQRLVLAAVNVVGQVVLGISAVFIGYALTGRR